MCVVGFSEHLPEYLPYFEQQKNHVEFTILYVVSKKIINKHYGKTPYLHLVIFKVK